MDKEGIAKYSNETGKLREDIAKSYFDPKDYTALDGSCGNNCFDGVFVNKKTGELLIVEVKPLTTNGIKLNPANLTTGLPAQMTDDWIAHAVNRLDKNGDAYKALQKLYDVDNKVYTVQKAVIGVNSKDVKLVMLK